MLSVVVVVVDDVCIKCFVEYDYDECVMMMVVEF